ncbi:MAG: IS1634 family transposase [Proteobacteria bacterium]|nr:IS1634 family transposase [Pseudomonadota bacterium]
MYIETIPNRTSPPAILLREGYREGGKVCKRTLANLSSWDPQLVEHFRILLKGGVAVESATAVLSIERALPHGHVAAALGAARGSGCALWFGSAPKELQPVLQAMLVARLIDPASKLATHRALHDDTATSSLGRVLGVGQCSADDLYRALDWLHGAQAGIERRLARQHLVGSTLVLYDLSSTWLTGRCCESAARGHSRDGKRDDPQIVFGLVCTTQGCPISVEVFKGNTADPATMASQVSKLKERFGIERIAWAGDRGMLTSARIEQVLKPQGMDWVSSLRAPQIAQLAAEHGPFQPSLFDERNLLELTSEHFPGERLVVCRNPLLAQERARKRLELLAATEADLARIAAATQRARRPLRGELAIALRVGRVIDRFHMAKHLLLRLTDTSLSWTREDEAIAAEAALDGLYVIRTSVPADKLDACATVAAYKSLAHVERAFRSMKTVDLNVRPVFHYSAPRVRAHVFLCMLAYYVEWHMRQRLKPMLFDDEHLAEASAHRASPVVKALRSEHAKAKDASKTADDGLPLHSFRSLLKDLATLTYNIARTAANPNATIAITARPTPIQAKAFELLGLSPNCSQ